MNKLYISCFVFGVAVSFSGFANASKSCRSYSKTVSVGETICFKKSNYAYRCDIWSGQPEFNFVMKLGLKAALRKNGGVCDHLDSTNLKPNGPPYGAKINRDNP